MRSPNSNTENILAVDLGLGQDILDHGIDSRGYVGGGGSLAGGTHTTRRRVRVGDVDNRSISVGAADIDSDAIRSGVGCCWHVVKLLLRSKGLLLVDLYRSPRIKRFFLLTTTAYP